MAIDPSIALGIRPLQLADPLAQYSQFAQIQNAQNQNALAQYQLGAAQRADEMDRITSEAYKNSLTPEGTVNYNLLAANLSRGGAGKLVPAVLAAKAEQEGKAATLAKTQAETGELERKSREAKVKALGTGLLRGMSNPDDATLNSIFDDLDLNGVDTKGIRQQFAQMPDLNQRINVIKNYALSNEEGRKALEFVSPKPEKFDIGGKIVVLDMNPGSQTYKQEIQGYAKTLTPSESKPVISNVDVGNEVVTQSYDPVTGKITILERRPKGLTPGEARPQPSTVDLGGTVATRVFDPATGTFNTVSTEQKTAAPSAPTDLAKLQAERDALIKKNPKDPLIAEYNARIKQITTHPSPSVTNVNVSTEKAYGGALASGLAKSDIEMRDAALSAPDAANNANKILEVLSKGNIIAGPGAEWKLKAAKLFNIVGKNNDELIANTEQLQKGLAAQTLDSIKTSGLGAGAGFTNADRDFLEKARSGNIEMTPETLRRTAELAHKSAQGTASKWNARVQQIPKSAIEGTGLSTEQVSVPGLYGKPSAARGGGVDLNNPLLR